MANSIRIENPKYSGMSTMVPGTPGHWTLPGVSGMAFVDVGTTITSISVRICNPGDNTTCATSKTANPPIPCGGGSGLLYYSWSAIDVPVRNVDRPPGPGAPNNQIWATLDTSAGPETSPAVDLKAVGMGAFVVRELHVRHRRVYRVRFDAHTLLPLFNRLADLGMNVSNRVKLFKSGAHWVSDDNALTLEVNGTSATICAEIDIGIGAPVPVSWACADFHPHLGGVFAAQSSLITVNLLVN